MRQKDIKNKIREHFFLNPTLKLRVRQLERNVKIPLPSAIHYARELEREGFLKREEIGGVILYSADRTSNLFLLEKKLYNIKALYDSNFIEFLRLTYHNPLAVVFGSYSRGEDIETSDIDIYIELPKKSKIDAQRFGELLQRPIQFFISKNLKAFSNTHLANNIVNWIVLNGQFEVF